MTDSQHRGHTQPSARANRVKLLGSVLAIVRIEGRRPVRARMHQLSTSGGVLRLSDPLGQTSRVEMMFRLGSTTVHAAAEMLAPMWSTRGCLQPFRFINLKEDERQRLHLDLERLTKRGDHEA